MSLQPILEAARLIREEAGRLSVFDQDEQEFMACVMRNLNRSNAQLFQDVWVLFETGFKSGGYFVEFGACDGVSHSNTLMLEKLYGWSGILAEPAHVWINDLVFNRSCHIDRRCVFKESGKKLIFNQVPGTYATLSTIDEFSDRDTWAEDRKLGKRYEVETISLADLLRAHNAPYDIDYLSVDTEGSELDILSVFDFTMYNIKCISVEHNRTIYRDEIFKFLGSKGYRRKFTRLSNWDDWYIK
ncbi:FkbM family methyltransferase [Methylobacterium sp. J-030]|uniref:FkbM family methyltransferase n=1 Tax=Methylobacterium sp. J-030 TaxID=2836627 RepID=UPI001FB89F9F|nr:FkbM family methyltransferase [Methylobacterium sp. J-030]MCJ2073090.1 FkbM family methyltransferase [Methylobacterium sp. J-030]